MTQTVLFVDDDRWLLQAIETLLGDAPFRALTTTDPLRALPMIEWEQVGVLVCDIDMPGVDGIDLVVRARQLYPDVMRILLTAGTTLDAAIRAVNEAEIFRLLRKPISGDALAAVVVEALERRETLRRAVAVEGASRQRVAALAQLEPQHPGIGRVILPDGVYVVSAARRKALREMFQGTALADLAPSAGHLAETQDVIDESGVGTAPDPFSGLRHEYGKALPDRVRDIRDALQRAWENDDVTDLEAVRRETHALAGSAGTYGFELVGEAFREVEQVLRDLAELRGTEAEASLWQHVFKALQAAEETLPGAEPRAERA